MMELIRRAGRWVIRGTSFRRFFTPSPAPVPGPRLRIAVCFLIPMLGDVVMLFPLLDALRRDHPDAEISAFVSGPGAVLQHHQGVDHVYVKPKRDASRDHGFPTKEVLSIWRWWKRDLKGLRFDVAVLPRGGHDPFHAAHLAFLLGAPVRAGFDPLVEPERSPLEIRSAALLTACLTEVTHNHEVQRGADVLQAAGLSRQPVDTDAACASLLAIATSAEGRSFLHEHPGLNEPYFLVSPGASQERKEWPEERYAKVAARVMQERGWTPVIVGGPEVVASGDRILQSLGGGYSLAGKTDFVQLVAVSAAAQAFLGNDSGTGHVAGAVGTPSVILSSYARSLSPVHQTSPQRTHPAGPWYAMVQPETPLAPCETECVANKAHCITQVSEEQVMRALDELLATRRLALNGVTA